MSKVLQFCVAVKQMTRASAISFSCLKHFMVLWRPLLDLFFTAVRLPHASDCLTRALIGAITPVLISAAPTLGLACGGIWHRGSVGIEVAVSPHHRVRIEITGTLARSHPLSIFVANRCWPIATACYRRPADAVGERLSMNVQVVTTGAVGSCVQCLNHHPVYTFMKFSTTSLGHPRSSSCLAGRSCLAVAMATMVLTAKGTTVRRSGRITPLVKHFLWVVVRLILAGG
mmetsp:Transcript_43353/g.68737  ORF Transcript_43353/g.68737 Transcript_43353/m.68737 type:complete len:229 (-) Transcript_43353:1353-2039(-)